MGIYYRWFEEVVDQQRDKKVGRRVREEMRMQEKELEIKCWELEDKD